jgi:hypothetical protein
MIAQGVAEFLADHRILRSRVDGSDTVRVEMAHYDQRVCSLNAI